MGLRAGIVVSLLLTALGGASAAVPPPDPLGRQKPMRVALVRDARPGCAPSCSEWIAAEGRIVPGTAARFGAVLDRLGHRHLPVFIDSPGGSVPDALAIGKRIRALGLDVVVTRTGFEPCTPADRSCAGGPGDRPATPHGIGAFCASACVLILAGGEKRDVAPWAGVGVHQIVATRTLVRTQQFYRVVWRERNGVREEVSRTFVGERPLSRRTLTSAAPESIYDQVSRYLSGLEIGAALLDLMRATPSSGIHWMSPEELAATRIATDHVDGEYLAASAHATDRRSLPERAFLRMQTAGDPAKPKVFLGRVTWSLRTDPATTPPSAVLDAAVEVPDAGISMSLAMRRNHDDAISASEVMQLAFRPEPGSAFGAVDRIGTPTVLTVTPPQKRALAGVQVQTGSNAFRVDLAPDEALALLNQGEIESRPWLGFPIANAQGTAASLVMEHGPSGEPIVEKAFAAWQDEAAGSTPAAPKP